MQEQSITWVNQTQIDEAVKLRDLLQQKKITKEFYFDKLKELWLS
jgi:hypothetical protein